MQSLHAVLYVTLVSQHRAHAFIAHAPTRYTSGRQDGTQYCINQKTMTTKPPQFVLDRLEYLRRELRAERLSYGDIAELASLKKYIDEEDVELLEPAGVLDGDCEVCGVYRCREDHEVCEHYTGKDASAVCSKCSKYPTI